MVKGVEDGNYLQSPEHKKIIILILLFLCLIAVCTAALFIGTYEVSIKDIFKTLINQITGGKGNNINNIVVLKVRLPRIILAVFVGMSLAVAGGTFQGCFRNPLVEPFILGVSSGAAFGAALAIVVSGYFLSLQVSAFLFGAIAVLATYFAAKVQGEASANMLVLAGVIIGSIFDALVSILMYTAKDSALREITFWLMGGFYYATWSDILLVAPITIVCIILLCSMGWKLNILSMGDEEAKALGIHAERLKIILIIIATLTTTISVSNVGIIAWVGLMTPHAARLILGSDHRFMLPGAAFLGGIYMVICDTISRTITNAEMPVGIMVALVGSPYLIYLLRSKAKAMLG